MYRWIICYESMPMLKNIRYMPADKTHLGCKYTYNHEPICSRARHSMIRYKCIRRQDEAGLQNMANLRKSTQNLV